MREIYERAGPDNDGGKKKRAQKRSAKENIEEMEDDDISTGCA